jgi:hypothetical protein
MENQEEGAHQPQGEKKKLGFREFLSLGEVGGYFFRRKDSNRPSNVNIKIMHGINKISIIVFLLGIIFLVLKRFL